MLLISESTVNVSNEKNSFGLVGLNLDLFELSKKYQFIGFASGFIYICVIFIIQYWMKTRSKFELKNFAVIWNASMLVLNTVATIALWPTLVHVIYENFYASICTDRTCNSAMFCGFWLVIFPWLKIIELGDTILLVLQKRKLVLYYWCHHFGAVVVTWYVFPINPPSIILWLQGMINLSHVFIYLYGTTRCLGFSVPQFFPAALLQSEVLQMIVGVTLCLFVYYYMIVGDYCEASVLDISIVFLTYLMCFILSSILYYKRFYSRNKTMEISSKSVTTLTTIVAEK